MHLQSSLVAAISLLTSVNAHPASEEVLLDARQPAQPPSKDPFYQPAADFASQSPGSILTFRELQGTNYPSAPIKTAYQILYRTNDANQNAASAVTTLLIPANADFTKVLSYQPAYDEAFIDCSPSYAFFPGSDSAKKESIGGDVAGAITNALNRGIIVSVPDYEVNAAWTDGLGSGQGVLDSLKAVIASGAAGTGVDPKARAILYGYSGGSQATEWAAELAGAYAPALNIVAVSMGGLPVNVTTTNLALSGSGAAGYVPTSFAGLSKSYPLFKQALDMDLKPETAQEFRLPATTCSNQWQAAFTGQNIFGKYLKSGRGFLNLDGPAFAIRTKAVMGQRGAPTGFPLYVFKGTADEIVPTIQETDNLVNNYCADGSKITYVRYEGGTHGATMQAGAGEALDFVFNILDNGSGPAKCSTKTVPV